MPIDNTPTPPEKPKVEHPKGISAWTIPTVEQGSIRLADYATMPLSITNPKNTTDTGLTLLTMFDATGKPLGDIARFLPERILLQETLVKVALRAQIESNGKVSYEHQVTDLANKLIADMPAEAKAKLAVELEAVHSDALKHISDQLAGKDSPLGEKESAALKQARAEFDAADKARGQPMLLPDGETRDTLLAKRAARIVYDQEARIKVQALIDPAFERAVTARDIKPITLMERSTARVAMINGGQASGKGHNVGLIENQLTTETGMAATDRVYVNGDAFKVILAGPEHLESPHRYTQSQLLQHEVGVIKTRMMQELAKGTQSPHVIIDQVFPAPNEINLGLNRDTPLKLVVVATDVETAITRSFGRGEVTGRYEHTESILRVHRNVSAELPKIIADRMKAGANIQLEIYDNNTPGQAPRLIISGNLKAGEITIHDPVAAARFFDKKNIDPLAQAPDKVYPDAKKPNLDFLKTIAEANPDAKIKVNIPGKDGPAAQMVFKNGKLEAVDPKTLRPALEGNTELIKLLKSSETTPLLENKTAGIIKGIKVNAPDPVTVVKPPVVKETTAPPILLALDPAYTDVKPGEVPKGRTSKYERGQPIKALPEGGVLTVGPVEDFTVKDRTTRTERTVSFARDFSDMLGVKPEKMAAYCPEHLLDNNPENIKRFVNEVLVSRIMTTDADGRAVPMPVDQAAKRMRFTIATHSYGGNFVDEAGVAFDAELAKLGYNPDERARITKQVAVVRMAAPVTEVGDKVITSPFNTIDIVGRTDAGVNLLNDVRDPLGSHNAGRVNVDLVKSTTVTDRVSGEQKTYDGSHSRMVYMQTIKDNPALTEAVSKAVEEPRLEVTKPLSNVAKATDAVRPSKVDTGDKRTARPSASKPLPVKNTIFLGTHEFTIVPARGGPIVATNNLNSCIAIEIVGEKSKVVAHVSPEMLDAKSMASLLRAANVDNASGEVKIKLVGTDVNQMNGGASEQKLRAALADASTETGVKINYDTVDFSQKASTRSNEQSGVFISSDKPVDPKSIVFPKIERPYAETLFNANQNGYDKVPLVPVEIPGVKLPADGEEFFKAVERAHTDVKTLSEKVVAAAKLDFKAQIASNELVVDMTVPLDPFYTCDREKFVMNAFNPNTGPNDLQIIPTEEEARQTFNEDRRRFKVLSASELDPKNEAALKAEHKAYVEKTFTSANIKESIISGHNKGMIEYDAALIARELAAKFPGNKALAEFTTADKQTELAKKWSATTKEFMEALKQQPEFQGAAGQEKLNATLKQIYVDNGAEHLANSTLRKSIRNTLDGLDIPPDQQKIIRSTIIKETAPLQVVDVSRPTPPEKISDLVIDDKKLDALTSKMRADAVSEFGGKIVDARKSLLDHARAHNSIDPYAKQLSPADAKAAFEEMYRKLPATGQTRKLVDIALSNPNLKIVMIDGDDVNNYIRPRKVGDKSVTLGFSSNSGNEIYISSNARDPAGLLIEEAAHNAIKNIYKNNTSDPFTDSNDPRKALLFEAMRADMERDGPGRRGANLEQMRRDLHLKSYKMNEFYAEAVVHLEVLEAEGKLTPELAERYKHLNRFRKEVLHADVEAHSQGKPLPTIDPAEYRAKGGYQMDLLARAPIYTEGTGPGKKFNIPVEAITGLQGVKGVEDALHALGIPKEKLAPDGKTVEKPGYRIVENETLREKLGPGAKGTVIEIPEELLKQNPELYKQLTSGKPDAASIAMLDDSVALQFRNNQLYEQQGVARTTYVSPSVAAERLLTGLGMKSETEYLNTIKTGRAEISLDPKSPNFEKNKQAVKEVLEAHRALTEERIQAGKGIGDLPTVEMEGNKLVIKLGNAADPANHEIARVQQLQALMEEAPKFKASHMAEATLSQLVANRIQYQQKVEFFDSITEILSRKALDPSGGMPNEPGTQHQQEFLKAAKATQEAQLALEAERAKSPNSPKISELEAVIKTQTEKMQSVRNDAQKSHSSTAEVIHDKQMNDHVRNTRASRVLNSTGVIQGAMTLQQIENDPTLSDEKKAIKRTMAYTHMASGAAGVIVDTRMMTRPGSTLGVKFGAATGVVGMASSGYELYEAINANPEDPHYTRGIVMSSANLTASTLGTAGAITAWVSGGAGTAGAVGSGLMTASAAIAAPVALAALAFQLDAHADHIDYMAAKYAEQEQDIKINFGQAGATVTHVDIPGLKPEIRDYKKLDNFLTDMDKDKPEYSDGKPIDYRKLLVDPKEFRRVAASETGLYSRAAARIHKFLHEGMISREDLAASPAGWLIKGIGGLITGRDIDKEYEAKNETIQKYNIYTAEGTAAIAEVDGKLPGGERNYGERYKDYVRLVQPLEKDFPDQIKELEKLRQVHIALKEPALQGNIRAQKIGMGKDSPELKNFDAKITEAGLKDAPRYKEATDLAAAEPKDMKAIQKFLGISDEDWNKKNDKGKSIGEIITERAKGGSAQLFPILIDHVKSTGNQKSTALAEMARFNFQQEMKKVEPLLEKERAVDALHKKTLGATQEVYIKMAALKEAEGNPEKLAQAQKELDAAKANLLKEHDSLQTAVFAESKLPAQEIEALKEANKKSLLGNLKYDQAQINEGKIPKSATDNISWSVQSQYKSEASRYFEKNKEFLARSQLNKRNDIILVGLASSPQEYLQKKMEMAPTLLVAQATKELEVSSAALTKITAQNDNLKTLSAAADAGIRDLTGKPLGDAPILDRFGQPEMDKGVPVTAAHLIENYTKIITRETAALEEMKKQVAAAPDDDLKAKIVLKENTLKQLALNKAQIEQRNYVYKIRQAEELKNQYRSATGELLQGTQEANKNPNLSISEADKNELAKLQLEAQTKLAALEKIKEKGKAAPVADLIKAEAAFLKAHRGLAEKSYAVTRISQSQKIGESSALDTKALEELVKLQKDEWGMTVPPLEFSLEYRMKGVKSQLANSELSKNPDDPKLKLEAHERWAEYNDAYKEILGKQLESIKENTDKKAAQVRGWEAQIKTMEKQNASAKLPEVELSDKTKEARKALEKFRADHPDFKPPAATAPLTERIKYEKDSIQLLKLESAAVSAHWHDLQNARGNEHIPAITKPIDQKIRIETTQGLPRGLNYLTLPPTKGENGKFTNGMEEINAAWSVVTRKFNELNAVNPGEDGLVQMRYPIKQHYEPATPEELKTIKASNKKLYDANRAFEASPTPENQKKWMEATVDYIQTLDSVNKARVKRTEKITLKDTGKDFKAQIEKWKKEIGDTKDQKPEDIAKKLAKLMKDEKTPNDERKFNLEFISNDAESLGNVEGVNEAYQEFLQSIGGPKVLLQALESIESEFVNDNLRKAAEEQKAADEQKNPTGTTKVVPENGTDTRVATTEKKADPAVVPQLTVATGPTAPDGVTPVGKMTDAMQRALALFQADKSSGSTVPMKPKDTSVDKGPSLA